MMSVKQSNNRREKQIAENMKRKHPEGTLYIAAYGLHTVCEQTEKGFKVICGSPMIGGTDDGRGIAARFDHPAGVFKMR